MKKVDKKTREKRAKMQQKLREDKGFLVPIRAVDFQLCKLAVRDEEHYIEKEIIEDNVRWLLEEVSSLPWMCSKKASAKFSKWPEIDLEHKLKDMKCESAIVGYFAARLKDDKVCFGFSLLNRDETEERSFSKDLGMLKAMNTCLTLKQDIFHCGLTTHLKLEDLIAECSIDRDMMSRAYALTRAAHIGKIETFYNYKEDALTVRAWPVTFFEQLIIFLRRCQRYYKQFAV